MFSIFQSLWFLPLLLCKLGQETDPDLKLQILYTIPKLATHKVSINLFTQIIFHDFQRVLYSDTVFLHQLCVGPVLKTIQSLSMSPPLRPISLRLLYKLWQRQNRVFPHLQKVLSSEDTGVKDVDISMELQIAKAATIRDICIER